MVHVTRGFLKFAQLLNLTLDVKSTWKVFFVYCCSFKKNQQWLDGAFIQSFLPISTLHVWGEMMKTLTSPVHKDVDGSEIPKNHLGCIKTS